MKTAMTLLATLALAGMLSVVSFAQEQPAQSAPSAQQPNADQTSPDQSTPQAAPEQNAPQQDQSPNMSQGTAQSTQGNSFTGTVVKAGGKYVLKTSNMSYQLDDQKKAKRYENKQVMVTGSLDDNTSTIHVTDISPTS